MKKIINPAPPLQVPTEKKPLSVILSIDIVGDGTLTQSQDSTRNAWTPNRDPANLNGAPSPLVLRPNLSAVSIGGRTVTPVNPTYTWYIGQETYAWDSVNEVGRVQALGVPGDEKYYLETSNNTPSGTPTGRLIVLKNVDYRSARKVILLATFTDSASNRLYNEHTEMMLSSEHRPDDFHTVKLQCASTVRYNPLKDTSSLRTIKAVARFGKTDMTASRKFFWKINGELIPTDGSFPGYKASDQPSGKGQYKDTIVLDMDGIDDATLTVEIGETPSSASPISGVVDSCNLMWDWPHVELQPYSKGSKFVKEENTKKAFGSILKADGVDVDADKRSEYTRQKWWIKPTDTGVKEELGWGEDIVIDASKLKKSNGANVDVNADPWLLGPMEILTDDNDEPLIDDSGSPTASEYGGYVVGRC